ncbi:unnamed protein product [Brassicogethes aeneus]|uniref:Glucose-methanol-choline oxidoreductase N-terminal domain-containing protein n=1 Tax=Brassicogethes aeneus TaxID=1431903 RepID=A0A9P0B0M7_BRAAE|nr:unnamed protein product [Brassicogethes aeneus]
MLKYLLFMVVACHQSNQQETALEGVIKLIIQNFNQVERIEPPDIPKENMLPSYDFIVVGAGTAGCVVANRLTENPNWNVLLIEAGGAESFLFDMPILANYLQFIETNWNYKAEPSGRFCMGMDNGRCNMPRGRVMGGSSVLNYMIYTRGNKKDFDRWSKAGNTGWSYDEVLPYFKKIENFTIPEYQNSYHGNDGYVQVGYAPYKTQIADSIIKASKQSGFNYVDYNGKDQVGVSRLQVNMRDGFRESASRSYLHPIRNRKNLHVKKLAMVSKILIDPLTKQTYGVEFVKNNRTYTVKATKEVILSGGAINSPHLLMLSGIGPKKHLNKLNIPVLSNLKVGYNLMDHIALGGLTFLVNKNVQSLKTEKIITSENIKQYAHKHTGPFTIPGGCEVLVFQDLEHPFQKDGYPDIELLFQGGSIVSDSILRKDFGIKDEIFNKVYKPIENEESFMVFPMLMRPKSRGRIMLRSKDYKEKPYIYPNYFSDNYDMDTIIKGVRLIFNITSQPALKKIGTRLHTIPIPECSKLEFGSNLYFECMARYLTFTIYHQSGTCKMGPSSDKIAVVDPRLKVHDIRGLRVIGASVIPEIPAAHINAVTFMIGEKGSDMIKEDWGYKV